MRKLLVFCFMLSCKGNYGQDETLFPVTKDDLWGYMNSQGTIIIKPQFREATKFSEGLAAVRIDGKYGYINKSGDIAIKPVFDFAASFYNGFSKVYISGTPQIIKKDGLPVFKNIYPELLMIRENRFLITTKNKRQGILNAKEEWVIDTVYKEIIPTENDLYIVRDEEELKSPGKDLIGIVDEHGAFIVPYNIYSTISPYNKGLARIRKLPKKGKGDFDGFIDLDGNLVFKITDPKIWQVEDFDGELAKVSLSVNNGSSSNDLYEGFINRSGKLVIDQKKFDWVYPFVDNRALVKTQRDGYFFITKSGKVMNKTAYDEVTDEGFVNGKALVSVNGEWQIIDTNLSVLSKKEFRSNTVIYSGNMLFFYDDTKEKWSFWDVTKNTTPEIYFDYFDQEGFNEGLLLIQDGLKLCYINKSGEKIWEQITDTGKLKSLNIDYMKRGYYYAYSSPLEDELKYGGWGSSSNFPGRNLNYPWMQKNKINFYLSAEDTILNINTKAKKLFIVNVTTDTVFFPAQDSRLYLKIQALNQWGSWQDIEYLPSSWCGNSYHTLQLAPNEYWKFATPLYAGEFKTKLRAELKYQIGLTSDKETKYAYIYSNEFEGSVNPAQFWRKLEYHPKGIMDPYNN